MLSVQHQFVDSSVRISVFSKTGARGKGNAKYHCVKIGAACKIGAFCFDEPTLHGPTLGILAKAQATDGGFGEVSVLVSEPSSPLRNPSGPGLL